MVLGVLAYGYIIASVAASLANADSARAQYQEKLEGIKSFMDVCQYTSIYCKSVSNLGNSSIQDQSLDSTLQRRVIK